MSNSTELPEIIFEVERYINNYFNPQNDPNGERDYPETFLRLVLFIDVYTEFPHRYTGKDGVALGEFIPWQTFFAKDLALYKRAKFL
jgi:hypothetical protein